MRVRFPRRIRASRGVCPRAASIARWNSSSSWISALWRLPRNVFFSLDQAPMIPPLRRTQHLGHRGGDGMPFFLFSLELLAALGCQLIEPRTAAGFGDAPLGFEKPRFRHAVQ